MIVWVTVGVCTLVWAASAFILPEERRWRRALGVLAFGLFVGATVWLLMFSAGAAVLLAAGADYMPLGEITTVTGAIVGTIACVVTAVTLRRWSAEGAGTGEDAAVVEEGQAEEAGR